MTRREEQIEEKAREIFSTYTNPMGIQALLEMAAFVDENPMTTADLHDLWCEQMDEVQKLKEKLNLATTRLSCILSSAAEIQKTSYETMSSIND